MFQFVTATFFSRRTGRAAGCVLVALLCVLTTALFALADASASRLAPTGVARSRSATIVVPNSKRDIPLTVVTGHTAADSDNPFEHGRVPDAETGVPVRFLASSGPMAATDVGPAGVDRPLPERPPRS